MTEEVHPRLEIIGRQNTLNGKAIPITQFKNLQQKQETKAKVLSKFNGNIFRSIIKAKEIDGNRRLDKLERQKQTGDRGNTNNTIERVDAFGRKDLMALSTFPSVLTFAYTNLLSKEGDLVLDAFSGHNSRASDVLAMGRKYVGFDVHTFPLNFTLNTIKDYPSEDYLLLKQSSEDMPFADETFDFAITCPPYFCAEEYEKIYKEPCTEDLSGKDYKEFLRLYENCFSEVYRCLKKDSYSVVVIGDYHKNGIFYTLGLDTINICRKIGFTLHDINIYDRGSNIGMDLNPVVFLEKLKRFGTIHEWILIFKK